MNTIQIPCSTNEISDGYHTFGELYEHRCSLFLALLKLMPEKSWISNMHEDGSSMDGWFIAGVELPTGPITYHLPNEMWALANRTGATYRKYAPKWDGHTSKDVVLRLQTWIRPA